MLEVLSRLKLPVEPETPQEVARKEDIAGLNVGFKIESNGQFDALYFNYFGVWMQIVRIDKWASDTFTEAVIEDGNLYFVYGGTAPVFFTTVIEDGNLYVIPKRDDVNSPFSLEDGNLYYTRGVLFDE